jgi:hypothetical protein
MKMNFVLLGHETPILSKVLTKENFKLTNGLDASKFFKFSFGIRTQY